MANQPSNENLKDAIRIKTGEVRYYDLDSISGGSIKDPGREISIKAPKEPFKWWGKFDAADAIGRTMVLLALSGFAFMAALAINYLYYMSRYNSYRYSSYIIEYGMGFASILACAAYFGIMGAGILVGKNFGSILFRTLLVLASISLFLVTVFCALLFFSGSEHYIEHMWWLGFPTILASVFLFMGLILPLWLYWGENHVKYRSGYISQGELEKSLFKSTNRFAKSIIYLGATYCIITIIFSLNFEVVNNQYYYNPYLTPKVPYIEVELFPLAGFLLVFLYLAIRLGYKHWIVIIGSLAIVGAMASALTQYEAFGNYQNYNGQFDLEKYYAKIAFFVIYLFGFIVAVLGVGFWQKSDSARKVLSFLPRIFALSILLYLLLLFITTEINITHEFRYMDLAEFAILGAFLFSFIAPVYILFELYRYFKSDKAKAWCGSGKYSPPWQAQLHLINEYEEDTLPAPKGLSLKSDRPQPEDFIAPVERLLVETCKDPENTPEWATAGEGLDLDMTKDEMLNFHDKVRYMGESHKGNGAADQTPYRFFWFLLPDGKEKTGQDAVMDDNNESKQSDENANPGSDHLEN